MITRATAMVKRIWIKAPAILKTRPKTHKANKVTIIAHKTPST